MPSTTVDDLYAREIKPLPPGDRLRLLVLVAKELADDSGPRESRKRNIMDLHGLGAEIWKGVDAQEYVDELRKEWDERP